MAITKTVKPLAPYQVWTGPDATASGMVEGDILDVYTSLGHPATNITLEAVLGSAVVRFNVGEKIYKNQESLGNTGLLGADAAFYDSPTLVDEIEVERPNITVAAGNIETWNDEIGVYDIKVVTISGILTIIAT